IISWIPKAVKPLGYSSLTFSEMNFSYTNDNRYAWRLNCEDGSPYGINPDDYETREEYNEALYKEKYRWRNFCEDGTDYGIAPEDYETEEEYEDALKNAREMEKDYYNIDFVTDNETGARTDGEENEEAYSELIEEDSESVSEPAVLDPFADDDFHVYVYCLVKLPSVDDPVYYRTEDHSLRRGDQVLVPAPGSREEINGEIVSVEHHMRFSVPVPVEETLRIIQKMI
ncbi:MAG: hypothetical protein LIP11_04590, partial [Clostridiales bacterium]|nr:hypothetical protein [Clostridiales bacterium]